jgi:hypothetical protein
MTDIVPLDAVRSTGPFAAITDFRRVCWVCGGFPCHEETTYCERCWGILEQLGLEPLRPD